MIIPNHGIENDTNWTRGRRIECLRRSVVLLRDEAKKKQKKETKKNNAKQATQNEQTNKKQRKEKHGCTCLYDECLYHECEIQFKGSKVDKQVLAVTSNNFNIMFIVYWMT